MKEFLRFFQRKIEIILKYALTNKEKCVILSNTETSRRDGRVDEGATLEMWCGATHRGFESLSLRHFFCQKNGGMKPSGFASWHAVPLHASQDALHILRHRRKMLHKKRLTMKQLPSSFHYAAASHFILL